MISNKMLVKILEEMQRSGDMSFTCPVCKDIVAFDCPQCDCGFLNPVMNGSMNINKPEERQWL